MDAHRFASPTRVVRHRKAAAVATAVLLALMALAAAPASADWHPPVDLSATAGPNWDARVAVSPGGDAVAVWWTAAGAVQSALRPAGGSWQPAVDISAPGEKAASTRVAIAADGSALAIWIGAGGVVTSTARPAGGSWQAPVAVAADTMATEVQLVIDPRGDALAAWIAGGDVRVASRSAGGAWQPPTGLSPGCGDSLSLAVGSGGDAAAAWICRAKPDYVRSTVQSAVRPAGGAWQAPENVFVVGAYASGPVVAVDSHGTAILAWSDKMPTYSGPLYAATRPAGGSWEAPTTLATAGSSADLAIDARGDAIAIWDTGGLGRYPGRSQVRSAVRPAGGAWAQPVDVQSAEGRAISPRIAIDARGDAVAAWTYHRVTDPFATQDPDVVQGAVRPAGSAWQPPTVLSAAGRISWLSALAADPRGGAVAVWLRGNVTETTVQSATYDPAFAIPPVPTPPAITGLRVTRRSFRAARSGPAVQAGRPGTRVSYALDGAATVRFDVRRIRPGRRAGESCVKPGHANRGQPSCERLVRVRGGFSRSRPAGGDRFTFTGRVGGRTLRPGRYFLFAKPVAGGLAGTQARTSLRIVR